MTSSPTSIGKVKIEDDDVAYGFNLGLMLTPRDGTRFGLTYRSDVELEFEDTAQLKNIGPVLQGIFNGSGLAGSEVDIDLTIPQAIMFSAYHQLTGRWAIMAISAGRSGARSASRT